MGYIIRYEGEIAPPCEICWTQEIDNVEENPSHFVTTICCAKEDANGRRIKTFPHHFHRSCLQAWAGAHKKLNHPTFTCIFRCVYEHNVDFLPTVLTRTERIQLQMIGTGRFLTENIGNTVLMHVTVKTAMQIVRICGERQLSGSAYLSAIGYMSAYLGSKFHSSRGRYRALFVQAVFTVLSAFGELSYVLGSHARTEGSVLLALPAYGIGVVAALAGDFALRRVSHFFENLNISEIPYSLIR